MAGFWSWPIFLWLFGHGASVNDPKIQQLLTERRHGTLTVDKSLIGSFWSKDFDERQNAIDSTEPSKCHGFPYFLSAAMSTFLLNFMSTFFKPFWRLFWRPLFNFLATFWRLFRWFFGDFFGDFLVDVSGDFFSDFFVTFLKSFWRDLCLQAQDATLLKENLSIVKS